MRGVLSSATFWISGAQIRLTSRSSIWSFSEGTPCQKVPGSQTQRQFEDELEVAWIQRADVKAQMQIGDADSVVWPWAAFLSTQLCSE